MRFCKDDHVWALEYQWTGGPTLVKGVIVEVIEVPGDWPQYDVQIESGTFAAGLPTRLSGSEIMVRLFG